jgi:hypothetical protein
MQDWISNPYYQAFCGMEHFQWQLPCDPSELVHFRKRIAEAGVELIFSASVALHGKKALEKEVVLDTTVQEKTSPPAGNKFRLRAFIRRDRFSPGAPPRVRIPPPGPFRACALNRPWPSFARRTGVLRPRKRQGQSAFRCSLPAGGGSPQNNPLNHPRGSRRRSSHGEAERKGLP